MVEILQILVGTGYIIVNDFVMWGLFGSSRIF